MLLKRKRSGSIAIAGIFLALIILVFYLASVFSTGTAGFLYCGAIVSAFIKRRIGLIYWLAWYAASLAVMAIILPDKVILLTWALFFGPYAAVKSFSDTRRTKIAAFMIKYGFLLAAETAVILIMYAVDILPDTIPWFFYAAGALLSAPILLLLDRLFNPLTDKLDVLVSKFRSSGS